MFHIRAEVDDSLIAQGLIGYKQCPLIVDTRESITNARADITTQ
jgi:hypothetical protein